MDAGESAISAIMSVEYVRAETTTTRYYARDTPGLMATASRVSSNGASRFTAMDSRQASLVCCRIGRSTWPG